MKKISFLILLTLTFIGCAMFSLNYKLGNKAALNRDWDEAISYYEKAIVDNPTNSVYQLALLRTKIVASYDYLTRARELASQGKKEEALTAYKKALSYGALARMITEEMKALEEVKIEEPKETRLEPPVKLKVDVEKIDLKFPVETPLRTIFQALGKLARINILFDEQFRDIPLSPIDLVNMSFEQALNLICLSSKNFYTIIDERTIIVSPDLPQKRAQYELNAIKTFYLSNISAEDIRTNLQQMLRTQFKQPQIFVDKNMNSVTIRDTPPVVELAEKLIRSWDKAKGEVIIDLEIMEVSRTRLLQLGVELEQTALGLRYKLPETETTTGWIDVAGVNFSKKENFQVALPAALLNFLESDADTKIISQPRLRGLQDEKIEYMVGDQIPVPQTTFTPIAAGGVSQQPIVNYQYKDVGIDVKIVPKVHFENEITLELEIEIKSLAGTGFADLPIITTRRVKNMIRLRNGETNLLAGLLKDEERRTLSGIAGLKSIPIIGALFSTTDQRIQQSDVILTITPYIVRKVEVRAEDKKPVWVGPEGVSGERAGGVLPEAQPMTQRAMPAETPAMTARRVETGRNRISFSPQNPEVALNRPFNITLVLSTQEEVANLSVNISFNPEVIRMNDVIKGALVNQLGADVPFLKNIDNSSGVCTIGFSSPEIGRGLKGSGIIAVLAFQPMTKGESIVSVTDITAHDPGGRNLSFEAGQSRVTVR